MQRKQHLNHPGLEPLWQSLEREWLVQLSALLLLVTAGLVVVAVAINGYWILLLLGVCISTLGGYQLYRHLSLPRMVDRLLEVLHETPEQIVWVYSMVNDHHPFGLQFLQRGILYFKLQDGDEVSANLPPQKLKLVSKILSRALPDTVFGYSNERARLYAQDPTSVKNAG